MTVVCVVLQVAFHKFVAKLLAKGSLEPADYKRAVLLALLVPSDVEIAMGGDLQDEAASDATLMLFHAWNAIIFKSTGWATACLKHFRK